MSTSDKHPNTIRQGGPGASHENAKKPMNEPELASISVRCPDRPEDVVEGLI